MASSNLPVKQFTKSLRGLPNELLSLMVSSVSGATLAQPHTKNRMIKFIVDNRSKVNIHQVDTSVNDIEDRKKQVVGFTILMRIIINVCAQNCSKYTFGTLRIFIHLFYDINVEDKAVLFKPGLSQNLLTFSQYITDKDEFENVYHFKEKFNEIVFDVIEKDIMMRVYNQVSLLAGTHAYHTDGNNDRHNQFLGNNPEKLIIYSLCNANLDGFDDDSFDYSPDIDEPSNTLPNFIDATDVSTTPSAPAAAAAAAPVAPAPVAPVDNTNIQAPVAPPPDYTFIDTSEPIVKVVTDPKEWDLIMFGEQRDENDKLVKVSHLKELLKHKINKNSWNKLRKKHMLTGRWNVYIDTAPFIGDNPKQNNNLKYQHPLCVDPSWQYAYMNLENEPVSDFPYGTIYLLSQDKPSPPPS